MPVAPQDIRDMAEKLWAGTAIPKRDENCVRTVAGRAYYSAFHAAREALRSAYATPAYDVGHKPLADFMIGSGDPTLRTMGNLLKSLLAARESADYNLAAAMTHAAAETFVDDATDVVGNQGPMETGFRAALPQRVQRKA